MNQHGDEYRFDLDKAGRVLRERTFSGTKRQRYGVVTDHLGSPTMLTTEAGELAWRAQFDVYGVPREEEGVAGEDRETGLFYNRFRYYDLEAGAVTCLAS